MIFGAKNKRELKTIKKDIENLFVIHVNELISSKFVELMFDYSKSHGLAVPDALIAATCIVNNIPIYTLNIKDFRFVNSLSLYQ